uniref:Leucine-rich repeat-containing N-terminal plant-type domain-containing protein n=1 Tax=Solanum lycopersicum TaxID=4081 RepID=A0A3Q7J9S4_SOLLC
IPQPLIFARSLFQKLNSWNMSRDYCSWDGVICDEMTGHVIELDLSCSNLAGTIDSNSSLFQLSHLQRLDLSLNNFSDSHISPEFGKFSSLTHLDLSDSNFSGLIPCEISHLPSCSLLVSMVHYVFHQIPQHSSSYPIIISVKKFLHITLLVILDLARNNLRRQIPPCLEKLLPSKFWNNNLSGNIPTTFSNKSSLSSLNLHGNKLGGKIPQSLANCKNIQILDLGNNNLNHTFCYINKRFHLLVSDKSS